MRLFALPGSTRRALRAALQTPIFDRDVQGLQTEASDVLELIDRLFAPGTAFATHFPGGVHFDRAEPDPTRPYVIVDLLSELPILTTEDAYAEATSVQFTIVCDSIPDGRRLRKILTRHATEGLDHLANAALGFGDYALTALRTGGTMTLDPVPNPDGGEAILSTVDYLFLLSRET